MTVNYRLDLRLVNLFYDERHGYDDVRMDFGECLHNDLRAWDAGQEMHVSTDCHFKEEFEHKSVHMGGREHSDDLGLAAHLRLGHVGGDPDVGVEGSVRNHNTL